MATNPENLDFIHTRHGKVSGGHRRALPEIGASKIEVDSFNLNGHLDPSTPAEKMREYLLPPTIYGNLENKRPKGRSSSRNF